MSPADRFRVHSVTKTFVAAAALRLAEQGKLHLDDTVEHWLPGLLPRGEGDTITVRQLLQHTSGLSNLDDPASSASLDSELNKDIAHVFPPGELIALAARQPLDFQPGTSWNYSNTGYLVLGKIMEKATGLPLGTVLARQLFRPLGLRSTTFDAGPKIGGRFAHGYIADADGKYTDGTTLTAGAWAAGAIVSTAGDLATFYADLLAGKVLRPSSLRSMTTTVRASGPYYNLQRAGLGIFRYTVFCSGGKQREAWGHTGGNPATTDVVLASRDGSRVVVLMVNTGGLLPETFFPRADAAYCRAAAAGS